MALKTTRSIIAMVITLMIFECVAAAFVQPEPAYLPRTSVHQKTSSASLFSTVLSEKAEERNGEERGKFITIELADLSQIAVFLSGVHSPNSAFRFSEHRSNPQPSLFKRFCVYLV